MAHDNLRIAMEFLQRNNIEIPAGQTVEQTLEDFVKAVFGVPKEVQLPDETIPDWYKLDLNECFRYYGFDLSIGPDFTVYMPPGNDSDAVVIQTKEGES